MRETRLLLLLKFILKLNNEFRNFKNQNLLFCNSFVIKYDL